MAKARIPFQVDIGYGDAVIPKPEEVKLPSFLDLPSLELRIYPAYGVVAEKFQAMLMLGLANSRMKDFYDIRFIANTMKLDAIVKMNFQFICEEKCLKSILCAYLKC